MEITLLVDERALDLSLPEQLPIALLEPDLRTLTGLSGLRLSTLTGAPLDHDQSLAGNGVRGGALIRCEPVGSPLAVYDDVVEVVPQPEAREPSAPSATPMLITAVLAAYLLGLIALPVPEILVLVATTTAGVWQRIAMRISGPSPDDDPRDHEVRRRVATASRSARWCRRALELLAITGGLSLLARPNAWSVAAGWCCLLMTVLRDRAGDQLMLRAGCGALAVGLAVMLQTGLAPLPAVVGIVVAVFAVIGVVGRPALGPTTELWLDQACLLLTVAAPALALVGSGIVPWPP